MNITIKRRPCGEYQAWIAEKPGFFAYGKTPEAALGNLILFYPELFNAKINTV